VNNQVHQTIRLPRGSRHLVPVVPDTRILVRHGTIELRPPPEWPADTFFQNAWRLDAEACLVTTVRGYAALTATEDAAVLIIPPAPAFPSLGEVLARIGKIVHWLRRRPRSMWNVLPRPQNGQPERDVSAMLPATRK